MTVSAKSFEARQVKNTLARWLISAGGVSVLFTLVLIFLYLVYVIKPVFESATIEPVASIPVAASSKTLAVGIDEQKHIAFHINQNGNINFYQTNSDDKHQANELLLSQSLLAEGEVIQEVLATNINQYIILLNNGSARVIQPSFKVNFVADERTVTPTIFYPLGDEAIFIDEQESEIDSFSFTMNEERAIFVALTKDKRFIKTSLIAEDDFNYDSEFSAEYQIIAEEFSAISHLAITPDLLISVVVKNNNVTLYDLGDDWDVPVITEFNPVYDTSANITSMALLSGSSSILFGTSDGEVLQWFEVASENARKYQQIRSFKASTDEPVSKIYPETYRKSFYAVTPTGEVGVYYTTSEAKLWQGKLLNSDQQPFAIAPRANGLITSSSTLDAFDVENEHPEVTWSAIWQEVWYEGYPEPDYIWQSTSGSDDFEAKFSLMPISFGTLKAAMYAMLFAVPIAISAAIYTAYFMPPGLRKTVKPTIELMEALPTVILGFLAGLWLAPLIEAYLPAVFLLLIVLPLATVLTAFAWFKTPKSLKLILPESFAPLILLPFLLFAGWLSFECSPVIEDALFGGDMRQYITNDLGINFDQRNALVVGIAMGFAVVPTIFSMTEDAIFSVPKHLTSGSLALGATQWQTLVKVVLLTASPGIFSAVMMGLGRAVGETMIVLMATGNTPVIDWSIFQGMRTLSANIAVEMPESEVGSSHYRILFLAAFVLFVFTFIFNTLAEFVRQRLREKYSSL
ncbi:ABC transporter permease subunit [Thalassomonas sp. M1454]|uniref:ABC transporter permease subunit n=1 Tax=Thalassomonas sp. M1454 TaxID=2594477 RepID=UPI00163D9694|nr:ABC transporter permease subunit [Thalassomonas sp. M1454]